MAQKIELPPYETVALVLQGGGALGSYQAGVYQGLHEAGIQPNWFAGISIGAVNAAILAGNAPEQRVARLHRVLGDHLPLRACCRTRRIEAQITALAGDGPGARGVERVRRRPRSARRAGRILRAAGARRPSCGRSAASRRPASTTPRRSRRRWSGWSISTASMRARRASRVGAVDIETGNFAYFDNAAIKIVPEHIMASGALPPGFPAVEIEGRHYWDGGLVSNTPLTEVLGHTPRRDTIAFQVDLWSADRAAAATTSSTWRSARRTSAIPAAPAWRPTPRPSCSACAAP